MFVFNEKKYVSQWCNLFGRRAVSMQKKIDLKGMVLLRLLAILCVSLLSTTSVVADAVSIATTKDITTRAAVKDCPQWLNYSFRQLHSDKIFNLCDKAQGKSLLIVNTASHCGFTYQFSALESIHQQYKKQGLVVIGFSSNDFHQEAQSESKAASICYQNYGVNFTMVAPISVVGTEAHPLFQYLAAQSQAPSWNFNKFLVDTRRNVIQHFSASVSPHSTVFTQSVDALL